MGVLPALKQADIAVARVDPRQARDFVQYLGVLAKTDVLDARTLRLLADVLARHPEHSRSITPRVDEQRANNARG